MVRGWFRRSESDYNDFIKALLLGDTKAMNAYMNRIALSTFSYFDTGRGPSGSEPERFYPLILEFKVPDPEDETSLKDTVNDALRQIQEKQYSAQLLSRGIMEDHIRCYGFTFQGKKVLIG